RAASASRLARLRAARRCFDCWRLSGTVDNGRAVGAPTATRRTPATEGSGTMTEGWGIAADSPLLAIAAAGPRRARFRLPLAAPAGPPPAVPGLLAGAVEVDITPPPGLPKAGYSRNARTGTGFRTRLRARVLHLRAGTGSLAIVQCDL